MHQEKYSLAWHTYSDHLKSMMKELMMNEDFSDVTLVTEDKKHIRANTYILSTCSPVFKYILKKEKNFYNPIVYLRGIQFSEMESILQFIYLGEATFYKERMDEFLAVAKSLEIKEICNAGSGRNEEPDDEPSTENLEEQTLSVKHDKKQGPQERKGQIVNVIRKYECDQCQKTYSTNCHLNSHKKSTHEGVKYACNQCDDQFTEKCNLTAHIKSKHDGVRYACGQCEYQASHPSNLTKHIRSIHDGMKYTCNQCEYQATHPSRLKTHKQRIHDGVRYVCNHCGYQVSKKSILDIHIKNKHEVCL